MNCESIKQGTHSPYSRCPDCGHVISVHFWPEGECDLCALQAKALPRGDDENEPAPRSVGPPRMQLHDGDQDQRDAFQRPLYELRKETDMIDPEAQVPRNGCWISYYNDWHTITVFRHEVDARRHAMDNSGNVKFVKWGEEI